jgi:hypothetical protein
MKLVRETRYKDANRVWWRLLLYRTSTTKTTRFVTSGIEFKDREWTYSLERENFGEDSNEEFKEVFSGSIRGQYDEVPSVRDCIANWLATVNGIAIGFCVQEQAEHQRAMQQYAEDYAEKERQKQPDGAPDGPA